MVGLQLYCTLVCDNLDAASDLLEVWLQLEMKVDDS